MYKLPKIIFYAIVCFFQLGIAQNLLGQSCDFLVPRNGIGALSGKCAPVLLSDWRAEYDGVNAGGATVQMEYRWDDGSPNTVVNATESPVGSGNYFALASHTYPPGLQNCNYQPAVFLRVNGVVCFSSRQGQNVTVWDRDDSNGGRVQITPDVYRVCAGNTATVTFTDNSIFNCVPPDENDVINDRTRWIQWIYGTNVDPRPRISGIQVGGATVPFPFAGPVVTLPAPVYASGEISLNVAVPATAAVGEVFEIRLNNWNQCNPYPGNPPVFDYALIVVVNEPVANFQSRNNTNRNLVQEKFCPGDNVYFRNLSTENGGTSQFQWRFYNGPDSSFPLLGTSTSRHPTRRFDTPGIKYIELRVTDASSNTAGTCFSTFGKTIEVVSAPVADVQIFENGQDLFAFCKDPTVDTVFLTFLDIAYEPESPDNAYTYRFKNLRNPANDSTVGPSLGQRIAQFQNVPYSDFGAYEVIYSIRNLATGCGSADTARVEVHARPEADFQLIANQALCLGNQVAFEDLSREFSALSGFNNDKIQRWRWYFDYTNNPGVFQESTTGGIVNHTFPASGTYTVRLEVETGFTDCSSANSKEIIIEILPTPVAAFTAPADGCPGTFTFTNNSFGNQPANITGPVQYFWLVTDSIEDITYEVLSNGATFSYPFTNDQPANKKYYIRLKTVSDQNCEAISPYQEIEVFPAPPTNFTSNYDPFELNCGTINILFRVDAATQSTPDLDFYRWTVNDGLGLPTSVYTEVKPITDPEFDYAFVNNGVSVQRYTVSLEVVLATSTSCVNPAIQRINVNPVPLSDFTFAFGDQNCDLVKINFDATQKGLIYNWTFSETPLNNTILDDNFDLSFTRPEATATDLTIVVTLETTNSTFCQSIITTYNVVIPKKSFIDVGLQLVSADNGCMPFEAAFSNSTLPGFPAGSTFALRITNGGTTVTDTVSTGDIAGNFTYNFKASGVYEVRILATAPAPDRCTFLSPPQTITIHPQVKADFGASDFVICSPLPIRISDASTLQANIATWNWTITNVTTGIVEDTRTFTVAGDNNFDLALNNPSNITHEYEVNLEVISINGCRHDTTKLITIYPIVQANFEIISAPICFPYEVSFRNLSNGFNFAGTVYTWFWGDGTFSETSADTVNHIFFNASFTQSKTFNVSLRAVTPEGCEQITNQVVTLNPKVEARIEADKLSGCSPLVVNFNNYSRGNTGTTGGWYFKESATSDPYVLISTVRTAITYSFENSDLSTKIFDVIYIASNPGGCTDTAFTKITVFGALDPSFTVTPLVQTLPGRTVDIVNTTNNDPGVTYLWNFGDGNSSTERDPGSYTYETYGSYEIELTVISGDCQQSIGEQIIIIPIDPIVDFSGGGQGCGPLTISFTDLSQYTDADTYNWDFGDGGTSREKNPTYTYTTPGIYSVTLSASNELGNVVTEQKPFIVEVYPGPRANFQVRPGIVYLPDKPIYTANKSIGAESYFWDFGDGTTSTEYEPTHIYTAKGAYDITLVAINANGCTDTLRMRNAVIADEGADVRIPNAFTPSPDGPSGGGVGGGGINDVFIPIMEGVVEFNMLIYNRWGELLFESNSRSIGWDGYFKGQICSADVYVYKLNMKFLNGEKATRVGDVTLLR